MQLATEWTQVSGLHAFAARLGGTKVFRTPRQFAMLAAVTTSYWLVSATVCAASLFPLIRGIHQVGGLRLALAVLAAIGAFVVINEPAAALLAGHGAAAKIALSSLVALFGLTAVGFWLDGAMFAAAIHFATAPATMGIAYAAGNLFLLGATVMLPVLGAAYLLRLVHPMSQLR
ncbi:MAG TPA: hypothetical protein VG651_01510 [Stellaceae bacterium]|nr:hypothetical protein [Stellaceae bacterium]